MRNLSENSSGITFWEVSVAAGHVGRAHGCHVRFLVDIPSGPQTSKAFAVRCAAWYLKPDGSWIDKRGVSLPWPYSECRTFSGLLYRLVVDLDQALTDDEARAARRQPVQATLL